MRYIVGFASWMAVCFIALSRCFTLICPETSFKLFTSPWGQFSVFFTTWTLAVAYISPILTEVQLNKYETAPNFIQLSDCLLI